MTAYYPPPPGSAHYPYYHQFPTVAQPPQHHLVQRQPYAPPSLVYDEVRTLFVAGFLEDVKAREIYNLFREFPGYESSHLRTRTHPEITVKYVIGAMQAVNHVNRVSGSTLYIDVARSNSRSKRSRVKNRRLKIWPCNSAYNTIGYPSVPSFSGSGINKRITSNMNISSVPHFPQNSSPCPTLFVANLGPTCTEHELIQVFSRCPGFIKLKMQSTYGAPVAFVDFQDTASSTGALSHLQGTILYSSTSGEGMRLEFTKSLMGMRKKSK